ncbi:MAG: hypothetical protein ACE5ID_08545 [Acidobacteriota bacterium]
MVQLPIRESSVGLLYLPRGRFLQVASLGFRTFLADLIYLWSIQYYGDLDNSDRSAFLEHVYGQVITRLDPRYLDPYLVGALILVVEQGDLKAALSLLDRGMAANPDKWILPYEAGFWAYDVGKDFPRAAEYFAKAMKIPGAPPSTRRLHAEMFNKRGDKITSLRLWKEVLEAAQDENVRTVAANHVHDLAMEIDLKTIQTALLAYRRRTARWPPSLGTLVTAGYLARLPLDPEGEPYSYSPRSGEVKPKTGFRLRHR